MVTGGARGLGYEFCKAFLDSGCTDLAILDLKEDEAQAAAEELIKAACGQFDVPLNPSLFLPPHFLLRNEFLRILAFLWMLQEIPLHSFIAPSESD